jgi:hypothetical protein
MKSYERGMSELIKKKSILIVIPPLSNHLYHLYLYSIISSLSKNGIELTLFFNHGPEIGPGRFIEVSRKTNLLEQKFCRFLEKEKVKIKEIIHSETTSFEFKSVASDLNECHLAGDLLDINKDFPLLNLSLHSSFVSFISSADEQMEIANHRDYLSYLQKSFHFSNQITKFVCSTREFDAIIFLNGRDPGQAGVRYFAEESGLSWHALEHGISPGTTFHLETFQTQDRLAIQERMLDCSQQVSEGELEQIRAWYKTWSGNQRADRIQNPSHRSGDLPKDLAGSEKRLIPIFTTSLDEDVSSLGYSRIDIEGLLNQTLQACHDLANKQYVPIVVVHPNSLNKSWRDLAIIFSALEKGNFKVLWPWANVSSYKLLSQAQFCVTWRSTIALEAILQGVPSMNLTESTYDQFVQVPKFSVEKIRELDAGKLEARSLLYLFYWMNHGHDVFDYCSPDSYYKLKKILHTPVESSRTLGRLRYYYSIISVAWRWRRATPKQFHRFLQLFASETIIHRAFSIALKSFSDVRV